MLSLLQRPLAVWGCHEVGPQPTKAESINQCKLKSERLKMMERYVAVSICYFAFH